jgi:hypothetical protein
MKKTRLTVSGMILLMLLILLVGCGRSTENSVTENAQNAYMEVYQYRAVCVGDVLYFSQKGSQELPMIFALDLNTMETMPLCAKPQCEHKDKTCDAYATHLGGCVQLTASENQLYYIGAENPQSYILYQLNCDGSARIEAALLSRDHEFYEDGNSFLGVYHNTLYRCCCGQYVQDASVEGEMILYSQPLGQGTEPKELLRLENVENAVCRVSQNTLYCAAFSGENGTSKLRLYAYDLAADTLTELFHDVVPCTANSLSVRENQLVFGWAVKPFALSLETNTVAELTTPTEEPAYLGERTIFRFTSAQDCICLDYEGKSLYEGPCIPEAYRDKLYMKTFVGCHDGVFYFLLDNILDQAEHRLLAFDTKSFTAKVFN